MSSLGPSGSNNPHAALNFSQAGLRRSAGFPPAHPNQHQHQPNKQSPAPHTASPYQPQGYTPQQPPGSYPPHLFASPVSPNIPNGHASSRTQNPHIPPSALGVQQRRAAAPSRQQMPPQPNPPPMMFPGSMSQSVQHDPILVIRVIRVIRRIRRIRDTQAIHLTSSIPHSLSNKVIISSIRVTQPINNTHSMCRIPRIMVSLPILATQGAKAFSLTSLTVVRSSQRRSNNLSNHHNSSSNRSNNNPRRRLHPNQLLNNRPLSLLSNKLRSSSNCSSINSINIRISSSSSISSSISSNNSSNS
ncbi:hypothetical protein EsDP_00000059, partial [Epichloe bromicola]